MTVHLFASTQLAASPWKNGGGTTQEIACWPPGAGLESFSWRISIARIARSGPFSAFPGIDRVITLLDGAGVRLHSADGEIDHAGDDDAKGLRQDDEVLCPPVAEAERRCRLPLPAWNGLQPGADDLGELPLTQAGGALNTKLGSQCL